MRAHQYFGREYKCYYEKKTLTAWPIPNKTDSIIAKPLKCPGLSVSLNWGLGRERGMQRIRRTIRIWEQVIWVLCSRSNFHLMLRVLFQALWLMTEFLSWQFQDFVAGCQQGSLSAPRGRLQFLAKLSPYFLKRELRKSWIVVGSMEWQGEGLLHKPASP